MAALEPEAGIRALFLLYKRGRWGELDDLGLPRHVIEPALRRFEAETLITDRLSKTQVATLLKTVPGLKEAGQELRLAYALLYIDREKRKENAVVPS